jgi:protein MpaA
MNRFLEKMSVLFWFAVSLTVQASASTSPSDSIQKWCTEVQTAVGEFKWKIDPCSGVNWQVGGQSVLGRPIVYAEFGDPNAENTTLIFSMVHGDEITPLYLGLQLANLLKERQSQLINTRVVIAPLVNPDGFFALPKTRVNAHGVDVNRNFATHDWKARALMLWKTKYRSDPRRFPGKEPSSEPETLFQEEMIRKVHPQKILSVHSPLNFLDYDGPGTIDLPHFSSQYVQECVKLKKSLKAISGGFFPGSLGNYAGHRGIPTVTAELRSSDSKKAAMYWQQEKSRIQTLIHYNVPSFASGKTFP